MAKLLTSLFLLLLFNTSQADVHMWLPVSYQEKEDELSKAVDMIMDTERCERALKATISQDRSTVEHPVFKILCKDKDGVTYWELVDGINFAMIDDFLPGTDAYKAAAAEKKLKLKNMWRTCISMMDEQYINFSNVRVLTKKQPTEIYKPDKSIHFYVDFDAVSSFGEGLKYSADCIFNDNSNYHVRLRPRAATQPQR